ncbi:MAG: DUF4339 domain-containing protein, partial [Verrucomicrobiaceae bacterium]|nr:DUF4339 domain-containing protein [Verrucomicrobiaceae bacterium]
MNWYIDNAGAAEGPYDDTRMTQLAREQKIASDSLVWHAQLDAWSSVAVLSPAWWAAALPEPAATPKSRKKAAPAVEKASEPSPVAPKRRLAAPVAPSEDAEAKKESGGLLKKLFGFGKK